MTRAQNIKKYIDFLIKGKEYIKENKIVPLIEPEPAPFTYEILQMLYPYLDFEDFRKLRKVDKKLYQLSTGIYEDKDISGKLAHICAIYDFCYTYAVENKCKVILKLSGDHEIRFSYHREYSGGAYENGRVAMYREHEIIYSPYYLHRIFKDKVIIPGEVFTPVGENNIRSYVTDNLYIKEEIEYNPLNDPFDISDYSAAHFQNVNELNEYAQKEIKKSYIIRRVGDMIILLNRLSNKTALDIIGAIDIKGITIEEHKMKMDERNLVISNQQYVHDVYASEVNKNLLKSFIEILKRWDCFNASVVPEKVPPTIAELFDKLKSSITFSPSIDPAEIECFNKCYVSIRKAYIKCHLEQYLAWNQDFEQNRTVQHAATETEQELQLNPNIASNTTLTTLNHQEIKKMEETLKWIIPMDGKQIERLNNLIKNYNTKEVSEEKQITSQNMIKGILLLTEFILKTEIKKKSELFSAEKYDQEKGNVFPSSLARVYLIYDYLIDFVDKQKLINHINTLAKEYQPPSSESGENQEQTNFNEACKSALLLFCELFIELLQKDKQKDNYKLIIKENYSSFLSGGKPLQKRRKSQKASGLDRQHAKKKSRSKRA